MVVETATYVPSKIFEEKQFFFKIEHDCKLLLTSRWKKKTSTQKIVFRFFTTGIRASREMSWGKMICLSNKIFFLLSFLEFEWFICLCCKFLWSGVSNHRSACGENKIGEINFETLFSLNNFGLWAEKPWTSSKTVRHDTQNRSLHVQMNILKKKIPEAKIIVWKCSVIERKHRFSGENVFSGLSKAHFKCPVQHFKKKLIKVNFAFCGLFRTVCVFFWSERKVSQGFQNHKLSEQMKKLDRIILTQMLSENTFGFWAEKLGVLAKNYRHCCQNCNLRTFKIFWGKTVFFLKLNMIANFFGLRDEKNRVFSQKIFFRVSATGIRASREMVWGKMISLSKKFCFSFIIFGVWVISLYFCKVV